MNSTESIPTSKPVDSRLFLMMFLQYAVWGIWMPILPSYLKAEVAVGGLGFDGYEVGWILATAAAVGAVCSPFLAGQFADRYFSTERYLAVAMFIGGVLNWVISYQTTFWAWLFLSIAYAVVYIPTLGLTNSLAMSHLSDSKHQFPRVRVWGTVGWIAVAWAFPMIFLQQDLQFSWLPPFFKGTDLPDATSRIVLGLRASGVMSIVYGAFCLFLPHTPPKRDAVEKFAFYEAFKLLKLPSVRVMVVASLAVAAIHKIYFLQTSPYLESIGLQKIYIMPAMSIGQFAEIFVMVFLGSLLTKIGFRGVLTLGAVCYFLRFAVFGTTSLPMELIIVSQALHGFCFSCSFAAAYIYIDRVASPDVRNSAQTGFGVILLGIGPILGGTLNGFLEQVSTVDGVLDYGRFWYVCAGIGLAAGIVLVCLFRDESEDASPESTRETAGETDDA